LFYDSTNYDILTSYILYMKESLYISDRPDITVRNVILVLRCSLI